MKDTTHKDTWALTPPERAICKDEDVKPQPPPKWFHPRISSTASSGSSTPQDSDSEQESGPSGGKHDPDDQVITGGEKFVSRLEPGASVALYTPVIVFTDKYAGPSNKEIDPFETYGRTLSEYNKRIRHVPYVPHRGYTEIHEAFLHMADAVVIVTCTPERDRVEGMEQQRAFVKAVHDALTAKGTQAPSKPYIVVQDPIVNLSFDSGPSLEPSITTKSNKSAAKARDEPPNV